MVGELISRSEGCSHGVENRLAVIGRDRVSQHQQHLKNGYNKLELVIMER